MTERKSIVYTILIFMFFAIISATLFGIASYLENDEPIVYENEDVNISNTSTYSDIADNYDYVQYFWDYYLGTEPDDYDFMKTTRFYNNNAQIYCDVDLYFKKDSSSSYYYARFYPNEGSNAINTDYFTFYSGDVNQTSNVSFYKQQDSEWSSFYSRPFYVIRFELNTNEASTSALRLFKWRIKDDNSYPSFNCNIYNYPDVDGGRIVKTLRAYLIHGVYFYPSTSKFPSVSRTGFSRADNYWYTDINSTQRYDPNNCNKTTDFNVYPKWTRNNYAIYEHLIIRTEDGTKRYCDKVIEKGQYAYEAPVALDYSATYLDVSTFSTYIAQNDIDSGINVNDYGVLHYVGAYYDETETDPVGSSTIMGASNQNIYIVYELDPEELSGDRLTYKNIKSHFEYYKYQRDYFNDLELNGVITVDEYAETAYKRIMFYNPLFEVYSEEIVKFVRLDRENVELGEATSAYVTLINYTGYNSNGTWYGPTIQYSNDLISCDKVVKVDDDGNISNVEIAGLRALFNTPTSNYEVSTDNGTPEVCLLVVIDAAYFNNYEFALCDNSAPKATYHFNYVLNGGLFNQSISNVGYRTDAGVIYDEHLYSVSREYYWLDGIYLDPDFTMPLSLLATEYPADATVTLYYKWYRNTVRVQYRVVSDTAMDASVYAKNEQGDLVIVNNDYTYVSAYHYEATNFNPAVNFTMGFRKERTAWNYVATGATLGLADVYTLYEYVFIGWSRTYTDYTTWDTLNKDYRTGILTEQDIIASDTTLYAVFYLEDKDTCCEFWAWDDNINFKAIEVDEEVPRRMLEELTDRDENEAGLYYVVIYDYKGKKDETIILQSKKHTIGDSVELWNTDEALVTVKAFLMNFNYQIIGWSTTKTDVNVWKTITHKTDLDTNGITLVENPYEIKTSQTLYAVCCLDTVYSDVIKDYEIWNQEEGLTIDNDVKDVAESTWNTVKETASNVWDTVKNFTTNKWDEIWKYLKWILVGVGAILVLVVVVKIINAIK